MKPGLLSADASAGTAGVRGQERDIHRSQSGKTDTSEGMVLTPKNVQALRTLFNIAHRLDHKLGSSWVLVLGNLNTLDRILHSPQTTTQVKTLLPEWSRLLQQGHALAVHALAKHRHCRSCRR